MGAGIQTAEARTQAGSCAAFLWHESAAHRGACCPSVRQRPSRDFAVREHMRIGIEEMLARGASKKPVWMGLLRCSPRMACPVQLCLRPPGLLWRRISVGETLRGSSRPLLPVTTVCPQNLRQTCSGEVARRLHAAPASLLVLEDSPQWYPRRVCRRLPHGNGSRYDCPLAGDSRPCDVRLQLAARRP